MRTFPEIIQTRMHGYMNSYQKQEIRSLYILKAVCAFFIICIHCSFIGRNIFLPIIKIAVPCFFIISGYFLVDNQGSIIISRVKKQCKKLLVLILASNSVYFVLSLLLKELDINHLLQIKSILRLVLYGDVIAVHLWFLNAYAGCLVVILLLRTITKKKEISIKFLPFIGLLLLSAPLLGRYSFLLESQFNDIWFRNCFNVAIPFMFLGALIRKHQDIIMIRISGTQLMMAISVTLLLSYLEFAFQYLNSNLNIVGDLNIFTIPLSIGFFLLCIRYRHSGFRKWGWLISIGRSHSTNIYLFHCIFIKIFSSLSNSPLDKESPIIPFSIFLLSLILSQLILKTRGQLLSKKP